MTMIYPHFYPPLLATVSKQIRDESVLAYYHNVRLNFENEKALVDYLSSISSATLRELRYISVRELPYLSMPTYEMDFPPYGFWHLRLLFPGLNLSVLQVRGVCHEFEARCECNRGSQTGSYADVERLIKSDGFRELVYVSDDDLFLKDDPNLPNSSNIGTARDPQPSTWDKMIKDRDGAQSGAEARIYRLTQRGPVEIKHEFETSNGFDLAQRATIYEPIEVHVKRGKSVDYTQAAGALSILGGDSH